MRLLMASLSDLHRNCSVPKDQLVQCVQPLVDTTRMSMGVDTPFISPFINVFSFVFCFLELKISIVSVENIGYI